MRAMFANSPNATPDVSQWNISKATNMFSIFEDSGITRENYEKALIRRSLRIKFIDKLKTRAWSLSATRSLVYRMFFLQNKSSEDICF